MNFFMTHPSQFDFDEWDTALNSGKNLRCVKTFTEAARSSLAERAHERDGTFIDGEEAAVPDDLVAVQ